MDAGHIWDRAPAIFASGARPTTLTRLSQAGDLLTAQRAGNRQLRGVERPYFGNAYKGERSGF